MQARNCFFVNTNFKSANLSNLYLGIFPDLRGHSNTVNSAIFSPDGSKIVTGSYDRLVMIWDPKSGAQIGEPLKGHSDWVTSVSFSPDGSQILTGSKDKLAKIWDVKTGALLGELSGHSDGITSVSFSPDGCFIVTGSKDQ